MMHEKRYLDLEFEFKDASVANAVKDEAAKSSSARMETSWG